MHWDFFAFDREKKVSNPKRRRRFQSSIVLYPLHSKLDSSFEKIEISISQA